MEVLAEINGQAKGYEDGVRDSKRGRDAKKRRGRHRKDRQIKRRERDGDGRQEKEDGAHLNEPSSTYLETAVLQGAPAALIQYRHQVATISCQPRRAPP